MSTDNANHRPHGDILIVEDDMSSLKLLSEILTKAGYRIRPASDGELALRSVQAKLPDLILLDVKLPGMNGVEVCRRLKADPGTRDLPVIFISVLGETDLKVKALEAGGIDYISKPFEPSEVLARINTHLNMHRLQRRLTVQSEELSAEITERKLMEEALRENEERFRKLFEKAPIAYQSLNLDGIFIEANTAWMEMLGYSREEVIGHHFQEFVIEDGFVNKNLPRFLQAGNITLPGTKMRCKDGTEKIVHIEGRIGYNEQGDFLQTHCMLIDITERKRMEEALQEKTLMLDNILRSAQGVAIATTDLEFRITYYNPMAEKLFGYTYAEVIGKTVMEIHTKEKVEPERFEHAIEILQRDGEYRYFVTQETDDGVRELESSVRGIFDQDGKMVGYSLFTYDITERKQAEETLGRTYRVLQVLSQCNQALIHENHEQSLLEEICRIVIETGGYRFVWVGYPQQDEGKTVRPITHAGHEEGYLENLITWADEERGRGPVGTAIRTGNPYITRNCAFDPSFSPWRQAAIDRGYASVVALPLKTDGIVYGAITIYASEVEAFDEDEVDLLNSLADNLAYGIQSIRTNAEHKNLEQQLLHAQKMEAVGQLTGGVAHDFNNILAIVQANLELLGKRLGDDDKAAHHLQKSLFNVQRGAELTQRLLAFSRKQMLAPEALDLNTLIRGMDELLRRTLGEAIEIETVCAGGLWHCFADAGQVENALLNLALNARDAMPEGGKLTIETADTMLDEDYAATRVDVTAGQYVMLAVTDTGTGMSEEALAHAFEPFYTTKAVGKGSGLGLSMPYGFARQSRGHIAIYSEEGEGTTVKLYLPRYTGTDTVIKPSVTADIPEGQNEVVLVVEDEPDLLAVIVAQLENLGYTVFSAKDGTTALEVCDEKEGIDLLLTDVILPGAMSGRDIAGALKKQRPGIKVLYMSGYTENAVIHSGQLGAGVTLLKKPFSLTGLARKVREVLDR